MPTALPSWFTALPIFQSNTLTWYRIPNSSMQGNTWTPNPFQFPYMVSRDPRYTDTARDGEISMTRGQCGIGVRNVGSWIIAHGAGHNSDCQNGVAKMQINTTTPVWQTLVNCTNYDFVGPQGGNPATSYFYVDPVRGDLSKIFQYFWDGRGAGGHNSYRPQYDNTSRDRYVIFGQGNAVHGGGPSQVDVLPWSAQDWVQPTQIGPDPATWASTFSPSGMPGDVLQAFYSPVCMDPRTGEGYMLGANSMWRWAPDSPYGFTALARNWSTGDFASRAEPCVIASPRDTLYYAYLLSNLSGFLLKSYKISGTPGWLADKTISGLPGLGTLTHDSALEYIPDLDKLIFSDANMSLYLVDPDSAVATPITSVGATTGIIPGSQNIPGSNLTGPYNRFRYLPEMKAVVLVSGADSALFPNDGQVSVWVAKIAN